MKIGIFYTPDKANVLTFATGEDHAEFGRRLEKHANHLALDQCRSVVSLTDGAPWIRNRVLDHIPYVSAMLLDFYHLSEHIWDATKCCLGDTDAAGHWLGPHLSHVQEFDIAAQSHGHEVGPGQRRSPNDPCRSSRIRPMGPLVAIRRSLMPQSMVTLWGDSNDRVATEAGSEEDRIGR